MRTDEGLSRESFRHSEAWQRDAGTGTVAPDIDRRLSGGEFTEDGRYIVHSLSGHERNHLFLNRAGTAFDDVSLVSGVDSPADGRGFVLWDFNRDGRQDFAVVNANAPLLDIYRNATGSEADGVPARGGMIAVRFVGGNATSGPSEFSCRDGFGAVATAHLADGRVLKREHRCGEGYATQNSATMIIGIGEHPRVERLALRWPSGRVTEIEAVREGTLVTAFERAEDAPDGSGFASTEYRREPLSRPRSVPAAATPQGGVFPLAAVIPPVAAPDVPVRFRVFTTMATWCPACIEHGPQMRILRDELAPDGFEFVGVPVDADEDAPILREFEERWKPAYRLVADLGPVERRNVVAFLRQVGGGAEPALPSTIVTDVEGSMLLVGSGLPPVSVLRRLAAAFGSAAGEVPASHAD